VSGFKSKREESQELLDTLDQLPYQSREPNPWREALDNALICTHLGTADSFLDAGAALNAVVNWHVEIALDPRVSAYAQALIDRGAAAPVPAVPPDTGQILYALDRQIAALDAHALRLQAVGDYSAEFPAEDADRLREAKAMIAAAPVPQAEPEPVMWQQRWTNPGVNPNVSPEEVDWKPLDLKGRTEADTLRELVAYTFDGRPCYEVRALYTHPAAPVPAVPEKLWLWKNFVDGRPEYWAFDNPFPVHLDCGDPQTLGEPCGYALFKPSRTGRTDVSDAQVLRRVIAARPAPVQSAARAIADEQSYDNGLWFVATTATEAHLQAALRRLTAAVEGEAT